LSKLNRLVFRKKVQYSERKFSKSIIPPVPNETDKQIKLPISGLNEQSVPLNQAIKSIIPPMPNETNKKNQILNKRIAGWLCWR